MQWFLAFQFIDGELIGCIVDMGYRNVHLQDVGKASMSEPSNERTVGLSAQRGTGGPRLCP